MRSRSMLLTALRSAALLALLLVVGLGLNIVLFGYAVFRLGGEDGGVSISQCATALEESGEKYTLPPELEGRLEKDGRWLMLLDGQGDVIYDFQKPAEIPAHFSLAEVAGFTRWYLMDYPVRVHTVGDGLLVMGAPRNSMWKYSFETAMPTIMFWPVWIAVTVFCNFLLIFILSAISVERAYKKRDAARAEWIAAVSHDVRTPLASVLGYAGSLENDPALPAEKREQAGLIRANGEKLRRLIGDLNLTNRLEHSMEPLQAQWFSPAAVMRESAAAFLNDEANADFDISVDVYPAAAQYQLHGDRALMLRLMNNLIGNALRHNSGGCRVSAALTSGLHSLTLTVSDDGSGYPQEQLKNLSGKAQPKTTGHGLGLTIVRQIALAHGGKTSFYNAPNGGAACKIVFRRRIKKVKAVPAE